MKNRSSWLVIGVLSILLASCGDVETDAPLEEVVVHIKGLESEEDIPFFGQRGGLSIYSGAWSGEGADIDERNGRLLGVLNGLVQYVEACDQKVAKSELEDGKAIVMSASAKIGKLKVKITKSCRQEVNTRGEVEGSLQEVVKLYGEEGEILKTEFSASEQDESRDFSRVVNPKHLGADDLIALMKDNGLEIRVLRESCMVEGRDIKKIDKPTLSPSERISLLAKARNAIVEFSAVVLIKAKQEE